MPGAAANQALEASPGAPETIIPAWMARQVARAALFGIETERRQAATILGHAGVHREPTVPRPTFTEDVNKLLHDWGMNLVGAEEERIREAQAAVLTGKVSHDAK